MAHKAYGAEHQRRRKLLLGHLALTPGRPCPICSLPMDVSQRLDLCHESQAEKQAGQPGSFLAHASCNRREFAIPPQVRAQRLQEARTCQHGDTLPQESPRWSCPCDRPVEHHAEIRKRELENSRYHGPSHSGQPCPSCGGYSGARIW